MTTCTAQSLRGRAFGVSSVRGNRIPFRDIATAVSRREQAGRRGYVGGISFPRVCGDVRDIIRRRYFRLTKRDKKRIMY